MIHMIFLSEPLFLFILMISVISIIIQSVALITGWYRFYAGYGKSSSEQHRTIKLYLIENIYECVILAYIIYSSLLLMRTQYILQTAFTEINIYIFERQILFILIIFLAVTLCLLRKTGRYMISVAGAAVTLPYIEKISGGFFPLLFMLSLLFWIMRSAFLYIYYRKSLRSSISALSVKDAVDSLKAGILFCAADGRILLINRKMQNLMLDLSKEIQRNAKIFYQILNDGDVEAGCQKIELDDQLVYKLSDDSIWMFTNIDISIDRKKYRQITANDITEQWNITEQLKKQNDNLEKRGAELKKTIDNMKIICREEEAFRAKSRIHDVLGQRVALLTRSLRANQEPDIELLQIFEKGLPDVLEGLKDENSAEEALETLINVFRGIGVNILFEGKLPANDRAAAFFMEIITEGVTNAVRHGFSTEIKVVCNASLKMWRLEMSNNGRTPETAIAEGGGLGNMRRKLALTKGTLELGINPHFVLRVSLPRGGVYD